MNYLLPFELCLLSYWILAILFLLNMACGNSCIGILLTKSSSTCDVQEWLKEREFDETVLSKFKGMKPHKGKSICWATL